MPIHHAVLALLADGPGHGYELRSAFEHAVGPQWGGLNIGHLYQVLDRLSRDGLVTSAVVPQTDRPDRRVYRLTDAGRGELDRWLDEPAERSAGFRDELILKILAAARRGERAIRDVVTRQRGHELGRLRTLTDLARQPTDEPLVGLLIEAAVLHTKADLALLDRIEADASSLAAAHQAATRPAGELGQQADIVAGDATAQPTG